MTYILHRGFAPLRGNDGGSSRSRQIDHLLNSVGNVRSIPPTRLSAVRDTAVHCRALRTSTPVMARLVRGLGLRQGLGWAQRGGIECLHINQIVNEHGWPSVFVTEDIRSIHSASHLAARGIPIIAIPHNIGYLNRPSQTMTKKFLRILNAESTMCLPSSVVYTISEEEAWLLRNCGMNARMLPYIPSVERLVENRRAACCKDVSTSDRFYLALGTAHNPATMAGLERLIRYATQTDIADQLIVAGYGTDKLAEELPADSRRVKILGGVDQHTLDQLISGCRAMLTYQEWGVGALTRIMDWALAGVPVVCNRHAARSTPELATIHVCTDIDEIFAVAAGLDGERRTPPDLPTGWSRQVNGAANEIAELLVSRPMQTGTSDKRLFVNGT